MMHLLLYRSSHPTGDVDYILNQHRQATIYVMRPFVDLLKARPPKVGPRAAECLAGAMAATVLTGWVLRIPVLTSLHAGSVSMKPNTALAFLLLAGALHWAD